VLKQTDGQHTMYVRHLHAIESLWRIVRHQSRTTTDSVLDDSSLLHGWRAACFSRTPDICRRRFLKQPQQAPVICHYAALLWIACRIGSNFLQWNSKFRLPSPKSPLSWGDCMSVTDI